MKFQLASDLHLEQIRDRGQEFLASFQPAADNLILAGDITSLGQERYLDLVFSVLSPRFKNIIYVPGNHEFWGNSIYHGWQRIKNVEKKYKNVHCLNNEEVMIDGANIFGGTGWYPRSLFPWTRRLMPDFKLIADCEPAAYDSNATFKVMLRNANPDIIVTHHMPTEECVVPMYKGNPLNDYFVSGLDPQSTSAKAWAFGHSHFKLDLYDGNCHLISNPRGYPTYNGAGWNKDFVVSI